MKEVSPQVKDRLLALLKWETKTATVVLITVSLFFFAAIAVTNHYRERFLPNTYIGSIALEGLTQEEAVDKISQNYTSPSNFTLTLAVDDITQSLNSQDLQIEYPIQQMVEEVFLETRTDQQWQLLFALPRSLFYSTEKNLSPVFQNQLILEKSFALKESVDVLGIEPKAELTQTGNPNAIAIEEGSIGRSLDATAAAQLVADSILHQKFVDQIIVAPVASTSIQLDATQQEAAEIRAKNFVGKKIILAYEEFKTTLNDTELIGLLAFPEGVREQQIASVAQELEHSLNREPISAEFELDAETQEVLKFQPHRNGLALNSNQTTEDLMQIINNIDTSNEIKENEIPTLSQTTWEITLSVSETSPEITLADTNSLGISERIGFGESNYEGSIPNRVHNVTVTSGRINNALVAPGEEFSFNKQLGDVSRATGFRPAYVIRSGKTELGDGGGVCQVSSTLFRALLDSGIDITKRLQHSYRVGYYEQNSEPGFDATVYSGNVDLKFVNDTDHHILVHTRVNEDERYLAVELYGTSDGRTTEISGYEKWGFVSALPTEYYPDPSLAPGQLKQIDWAVAGLKTKFIHTVRDKDGNVMREDEYYSNYRPWAAKFLQGI
ncbi:MAG: VanW family protein [Microgenomates group bacterium]